MFDSIYTTTPITVGQFFLMAGVALLSGFIYAWILSFKVRSTKRFFLVNTLLPVVVASIITFVNGNIGVGIAIGGAFALIRFRSAPGSADEIVSIFITMASGVAFGMGYLAYGVAILVGLGLAYFLLSMAPVFEHKNFASEKLLKITIPESLDYSDAFTEIFKHYLKEYENVGVKTTGMGSMYKLSFRIIMKNQAEEKEMIDEIRIRNGNLEVSLLPYVEANNQL